MHHHLLSGKIFASSFVGLMHVEVVVAVAVAAASISSCKAAAHFTPEILAVPVKTAANLRQARIIRQRKAMFANVVSVL